MKKLNQRQTLFCNYFVETGNSTYSAKKAGYSKHSARQIGARLIAKDNIQNYIHDRMNNLKSHAIASADEILKYYTNVMRGNVTEDYEIGTPDGLCTGVKRPDVSDRNKAASELMKRYAPIEKAKVKKINAEADIKALESKENDTANNSAILASNKLLDKLEQAGKADKSDK